MDLFIFGQDIDIGDDSFMTFPLSRVHIVPFPVQIALLIEQIGSKVHDVVAVFEYVKHLSYTVCSLLGVVDADEGVGALGQQLEPKG